MATIRLTRHVGATLFFAVLAFNPRPTPAATGDAPAFQPGSSGTTIAIGGGYVYVEIRYIIRP